jgi:maleate cis-trans isomerase
MEHSTAAHTRAKPTPREAQRACTVGSANVGRNQKKIRSNVNIRKEIKEKCSTFAEIKGLKYDIRRIQSEL